VKLETEKTVEGQRKPEGGTKRRVESSRSVDVFSDTAEREETLAGSAPSRKARSGRSMKEL
jgi:hypothetical protein